MEKDDEVKGSGNHVDFGARGYDPRLGRWLSVDPKTNSIVFDSPYAFASNSPLLFLDPDGEFKLAYTEKQLKEHGLTKQDIVRFETIVNNIYRLVKDNPNALSALVNTSGISLEQIKKDFTPENGPAVTIDLLPLGAGAQGGKDGIVFDPRMIKSLAEVDAGNATDLNEQTLGTALTLIHEYAHYGDQVTNQDEDGNGMNTGQNAGYREDGSPKKIEDSRNLAKGKQNWVISPSGHRGTDVEIFGFGIEVSIDPTSGKASLDKPNLDQYPSIKNFPNKFSIPTSLPSEAKSAAETLDVK